MDKPPHEMAASARQPARERLLAAAGELFYKDGVQSVGIDRIIEHAGVAKASLYGNFKGKDDLVRAYLDVRYQARRSAIEAKLALHESPRDKLLSVFDVVSEAIARPDYRGCAFIRAAAEMPDDASGRQVCLDSRRWTRGLFASLAKGAGAAQPDMLAAQLMLLYDGAAASAQMDRNPATATAAKTAAALLIDSVCARRKAEKATARTRRSKAGRH